MSRFVDFHLVLPLYRVKTVFLVNTVFYIIRNLVKRYNVDYILSNQNFTIFIRIR